MVSRFQVGCEGVGAEVSRPETREVGKWAGPRTRGPLRRADRVRHAIGRRQIGDRALIERTYSGEELEFLRAIEQYKRANGRKFPTWTEVLEVARALGYRRSQPRC
jgi:hypothetical protein